MVDYTAILLLFLVGGAICTAVVLLSVFFGPQNPSRWKQEPYEAGSIPIGDAQLRFDVKYYLVAISFIMFDVEAVFLIPWAIVAREFGAYAFVVALVFVAILTLGLAWEWLRGGLEWE